MPCRRLLPAAVLAALSTAPAVAQNVHRHDLSRGHVPAEGPGGYDTTNSGTYPTPPGGVPGNTPFNNQIRKHTAPFSANGGR